MVLNNLASNTSLVMFSVKHVQATLAFILYVLRWSCYNQYSVENFWIAYLNTPL